MNDHEDKTSHYRKDSLTLVGAVALGTGVMIGAGIFALTGQMAQMTESLFPLAFLSAALIVSFSAYSIRQIIECLSFGWRESEPKRGLNFYAVAF